MKRILTFILMIVLLLSLTLPAAAAGKIKASTMRLELIDGSAEIQNSSGVTQSYTAGMRLYSGYTLTTGRDSYAYISLDDKKAVKLDMLTTVKLKQSGKKLEVQLVSGQVFADVTAPLAASETLEIRTSTMVTGIRGSSAIVSTFPRRGVTDVRFLTGHGTVTDYGCAEPQTILLTGGHGYLHDSSETEVYDCFKNNYPAFALEEIPKNRHLYNEILAEGRFDPDELSTGLAEKYRQEAAERGLSQDVQPGSVPSDSGENPPAENTYSVILPSAENFYTITTVSAGSDGSRSFTVQALTGYEASRFTVFANGTELTAPNGVYAVENLTENVTVTIQAVKVPTVYAISCALNGGSMEKDAPPAEYTIESAAITLAAPVKAGYTFLGWTGTELSTPTLTVTIPAGSTGSRSYEAVWEPDESVITWKLTGQNAISQLQELPTDGLLPGDAQFLSSGTVPAPDSGSFFFAVQSSYDYPLVCVNGEALQAADSSEGIDFYELSVSGGQQTIEVQEGVLCWIDLPDGSSIDIAAPGSLQEETENGLQMTIPVGAPVSFELDGDVIVYLNGQELQPVNGVYSFLADEDLDLSFVPCITVLDGNYLTLQDALSTAADEGLTVRIDSSISIPSDAQLSFEAPVILAEGRTLTVGCDLTLSAEFTNNGAMELLSYTYFTVNEGTYFCNNGSITVDAHAVFSNYGSLDNAESGVITLAEDTATDYAEFRNSGYVQDFGTVVNPHLISTEGGEYRLYTSDSSVFQPYGAQLFAPGYVTDITFTGNLTIAAGSTLYLDSTVLYIGSGAVLTVSDGASVQIVTGSTAQAALILDNGSELVLNGGIYTNDAYGFTDNMLRYKLEASSNIDLGDYQVTLS